jgi:hypothetical protein
LPITFSMFLPSQVPSGAPVDGAALAVTQLPPLRSIAVTALPPTEWQPRDRNCNEIEAVTVSQGHRHFPNKFQYEKRYRLSAKHFVLIQKTSKIACDTVTPCDKIAFIEDSVTRLSRGSQGWSVIPPLATHAHSHLLRLVAERPQTLADGLRVRVGPVFPVLVEGVFENFPDGHPIRLVRVPL